LNTRANSIATLEQSVMSGLPFWDVAVELPNEAPIEDTNENAVPTNVSKVPYS
jgi:hypothetical protein